MEQLCPMCARREVGDEASGFCTPCSDRTLADRYLRAEEPEIERRRRQWVRRTTEFDRERQRHHRLAELVTPHEPPAHDADPWQIAAEALAELQFVGRVVRMSKSPTVHASLENAIELVRQLAVGPQNDDDSAGARVSSRA